MRVAIEGRVATVVIDRPQTRNALSPDVIDGLRRAIARSVDSGCTVLILRGSGGTLSAGADLTFLRGTLDDPAASHKYIASIGAALDELERAPLISVCVIDGYALAGGCEIVLACDLALASDRSQIGDRHLEYGLLPGAGGSVRMSRAMPPAAARRLLLTGDMIGAEEALRLGLISHIAAVGQLEEMLENLTTRLATRPPDAIREMKRLHRVALATHPASAAVEERNALLAHLSSATVREGLSAFAERRTPRFT
ncbi:MAG: enoyl-CoA hydratase/isomerase family protein [Nocardioides sp.]|uniref:enoyl-CoA hydratase/isomerase family protein n=1 Tax=Nocardioides sp. TaxID=35761 RepID=UPI0039E3592E